MILVSRSVSMSGHQFEISLWVFIMIYWTDLWKSSLHKAVALFLQHLKRKTALCSGMLGSFGVLYTQGCAIIGECVSWMFCHYLNNVCLHLSHPRCCWKHPHGPSEKQAKKTSLASLTARGLYHNCPPSVTPHRA